MVPWLRVRDVNVHGGNELARIVQAAGEKTDPTPALAAGNARTALGTEAAFVLPSAVTLGEVMVQRSFGQLKCIGCNVDDRRKSTARYVLTVSTMTVEH